MDNFLPDTDNFFKYLLTIGLILIVFVIVYPAQEQKQVDIEINGFQRDARILAYKIERLKADINEFDSLQPKTQHVLDSLKMAELHQDAAAKGQTELLRQKMGEEFAEKKGRLIQLTDSLMIINYTNEAEKQKIHKLEGYFSFFKTYKIIFLVVGVLLTCFGLLWWSASVYRDEKKKDAELTNHQSTFVKHGRFILIGLRNKFVLALVILLIFGAIWFIISCSSYGS